MRKRHGVEEDCDAEVDRDAGVDVMLIDGLGAPHRVCFVEEKPKGKVAWRGFVCDAMQVVGRELEVESKAWFGIGTSGME